MRHQPTPLTAGLLVAAAAVCVLQPAIGLAVAFAIVVAASGDAVVARGRAPSVSRRVAGPVVRGVASPLVVEANDERGALHHPSTPVLTVERGAPGSFTVTASRRGRHVLPAAIARVHGPLGLGVWTGPVDEPLELVVRPDLRVARRLVRAARSTSFEDEGGRVRGPLGLGTAFESLRDYLPDDDVRLVNWKATARAGRPIVNQFRMEQSRDVMVLVDAGRLHHGVPATFEAVLDAASALALTVDAVGDRCGLLAFADQPIAHRLPRSGGGRNVMVSLDGVEPMPVDSDYEVAFRSLATKRAIVVVFTDLADDLAAEALVSSLPLLSRRHHVIVVSTDDERASAGGHAAHAVAAALLFEDRTRAITYLRRAGATVVSARAARLSAAASRAYLDVKALARG